MFFWVRFDSNFLKWSMCFSMFKSVNFCTLRFVRGSKRWSRSITRNTHRRSILISCAISTGVGWAPGWYSWLRIISFLSSMFPSLHTFFSSNATSLSIFFNSFFPPFMSHSYSGWSLAILVAPCLYFIRRKIYIYFLLRMRTP